jgi:soluble lytic murein transglycosylase-like protein
MSHSNIEALGVNAEQRLGFGAHGADAQPLSPEEIAQFSAGPNNPSIGQWEAAIENASRITGINPNVIAGMIWAESRGNPDIDPSHNHDGSYDIGLMQISQGRWQRDVLPKLTTEQRAEIKTLTGKDPSQLNMNNPADNIIGGACELNLWVQKYNGDLAQGLRGYNTGEVNPGNLRDTGGIGSPAYVDNVMAYAQELMMGKKLSEDPHGK